MQLYMRTWHLVVFSLFLSGFINLAISQNWKKGKVSSWVKPDSIDYSLSINSAEVDGGYYYMLVDEQVNVETKEYYSHYVYRIINSAGVQNASELYFDFNPAFQNIVVHSVRIIRDGKVFSKLETSNFKVIQRESDLERHIYDNTLSVFTVLTDIRAGDILDYSYTIKGDNPIFENKFHYNFSLSAAYTILKMNERIVRKKGTPLNIHYYKETKKPLVTEDGPYEVWAWNYTSLPATRSEDDVPSAYRVSPLIEVSSYFSWAEVIQWATHVFSKENYKHEAITKKAKSISDMYATDKDRIIAALRFVQNQVRYYGFEIGTNAIKPHTPDMTLIKRFGDCKDKAVLFCALLQEMGIDSCYPVLVHADKREQIVHYIPSPNIFNHAIACVKLNHHAYFFDPTSSFEGGDFDHTYTAIYGKGLVIDPALTGIADVESKQLSKTDVDETYDILDVDGKARLTVVSTYYGTHADNERYRFANNSLNDIRQDYLTFYKKKYGELEGEDVTYKDDSILNKIVVTEKYKITCVWDTSEMKGKKRRVIYFYSNLVKDFTDRYSKPFETRKLPIGLENPFHIEHHLEVNLPEAWDIEASTDRFDSPYLSFERRIAYAYKRLTIDYTLKTLQGTCPAKDAQTLYAQLDNIRDNNWYTLYYNNSDARAQPVAKRGGINWIMCFLFLMFIAFSAMMVVSIARCRNPGIVPAEPQVGQPYGIGGWLVLPMLSLMLGPLALLYGIFSHDYFDAAYWKQLTDFDSADYSPAWAPAIIFQLMFLVMMLGFDVLCLIMLFRYERRFSNYMVARQIAFLITSVINLAFLIVLNDRLQAGYLASGIVELFGAIIAICIWVPYFMVSVRVKNTFTR